jgi:hypothetical protein
MIQSLYPATTPQPITIKMTKNSLISDGRLRITHMTNNGKVDIKTIASAISHSHFSLGIQVNLFPYKFIFRQEYKSF